MRSRTSVVAGGRPVLSLLLLMGMTVVSGSPAALAQEKQSYTVSGMYVEGCSCSAPCPCQLTGVNHGCEGVGALMLNSGSYKGVDLRGTKIAYATSPGDWVRLYVDVPNASQREAAEAFGRAVYTPFGKVKAVKAAKIDLSGDGGKYTLSVDGGNTMQLTTEPVLGGDNRTPLTFSNIHDALHPTVMQAKTISGTYHDGDRTFTLKDSNSYFTSRMRSKGKI
jgi:hypothetical protein